MARFTSIGMPRKTFVASAAEESQAAEAGSGAESRHTDAGAGTYGGDDAEAPAPKKKVHRSGKRLKAKLQRQEAIARGEMEPPGPTPPTEGSKSSIAKLEKKRKAEEEARGWGGGGVGGGWGHDARQGAGGVQRDGYAMRKMGGAGGGAGSGPGAASWSGQGAGGGAGWGRDAAIAKKTKFSEDRAEARREQRAAEKTASTICYACRGQGHSARECPNAGASAPGADAGSSSSAAGGMCYRCGSNSHTLAHCARPSNPDDPTPHATCYVCSARGHLSSQCPQNAKGVYVHGGKCNLCGSVRHRIGDCPERGKRDADAGGGEDAASVSRPLGAGTVGASRAGGAADEDDFMEQSRERIQSGALGGQTSKGQGKGKKMEKKEFNNNGLRRPYKEDESERLSRHGAGAGEGGSVVVAKSEKAKPKAKVVAF